MKRNRTLRYASLKNLALKPTLKGWKREVLLLLLPILGWSVSVHLRPHLIPPRCAEAPQTCRPEQVPWPDSLTLGYENRTIDHASFVTQDAAGAAALLAPLLIHGLRLGMGGAALPLIGVDWVIAGQTIAWNGFVTEVARLIAQRPRPFVYKDPEGLGKNPHHYNSFWSGHTSFTAAASGALFATLLGHQISWFWVRIAGLFSLLMVTLTGLFRMFSGRHFLSDVVVAAVMGLGISLLVARIHRKPNQRDRRAKSK